MAGIILVGPRIRVTKGTVLINYLALDWSIIHRNHAEPPKFFVDRRGLTTAPLTPEFLTTSSLSTEASAEGGGMSSPLLTQSQDRPRKVETSIHHAMVGQKLGRNVCAGVQAQHA